MLLALAPQFESQGIRNQQGKGDNLGVRRVAFKKILCIKGGMEETNTFAHYSMVY